MLGVCLLFVGIVLINNGMCTLYNVDGKSTAVMNIFTGGLSLFINFVNLVQGNYYAAGTGLLFCFTYLFVAFSKILKLNPVPFAWFSTFVAVNADLEPRETCKETQNSANGAYRVAVSSASAPCQHGNYHERHGGNYERRQAAHPHVNAVEGIAVHALGKRCQHVVACRPYGTQDAVDHTAVRTVGRKQRHDYVDSGNA